MKKFTIKAKISFLLVCTSILLITGILTVSYVINKQSITEICESYLYDSCVSLSNSLYGNFYGSKYSDDTLVELEYTLNNSGISTMESSQAYLVDQNGCFLYHDNPDMIGQKISGNPVIEDVLSTLQNKGIMTTADVKNCTVNGKEVYIAFMCTVNDWIVFIQADKSDVLKPIYTITAYCIAIGVILLLLAQIIGIILTTKITKPISALTTMINHISEFDLKADVEIPRTNDEIGVMGEAVQKMREKLSQIVQEINDISHTLVNDSNSLYEISENVNSASMDNSATNQELAASMENTTSATNTVTDNVQGMNQNAISVADKINDGTKLTMDMMEKANAIQTQTVLASEKTFEVYNNIKKTSNEAIGQAKQVKQINALANAIQEIADQTTLLSLNASIEAARAGEEGRGFAVVAGEISALADQSTKTSADIVTIVEQVNSSVETLTKCLLDALHFLEEKVISDYKGFEQSSKEYSEVTQTIQEFMTQADREVTMLKTSIEEITNSMDSINKNVNECYHGITDITDKTTHVVHLTEETFHRTQNCKNSAEQLNAITSRFQV
ncbi:MAG: methyl-accepting chemotaxis protein [Lachnospiraceae bacterium]